MLGSRHHGCRWSTSRTLGHEVVTLENRRLRVTVLPGLGADIVEFVHKPTDTDFLWRSPWPLRPAGSLEPVAHTPGAEFLLRYHGGWQELFPVCGDAADFHGARMGVHGEVCRLPWTWRVVSDTPTEVTVAFEVATVLSPFRLERTMTLRDDAPTVFIEERATNLGEVDVAFMWGHHPAFGAPFLKEGCRVYTDARTVLTSSHHHDVTSRLAPDQRSAWPLVRMVDGGTLDLSEVGGPDLRAHDWAYLTDFEEGWFALVEPGEGVGFACRWPAGVLPYLLYWQNYRGARAAPWYGRAYTVALEPQSTFPANYASGAPLLRLAPGASLELSLVASAFRSSGAVNRVAADGSVA